MDRRTVGECRALLAQTPDDCLAPLIEQMAADDRAGVQSAVSAARGRLEAHETERARLESMLVLERELRDSGFMAVAGADEVGRGALAGPLTVAAVILPPGAIIPGLNDSKKLTSARRAELDPQIRDVAVAFTIVSVPAEEIDRTGISSATRSALREALLQLEPSCDHLIMDGLGVGGLGVPETAVVGGDSKCAAIAAASIIAKVHRDAYMTELHELHPEYGFAINKGYGTQDHTEAISRLGLTPYHRRSFSPCGGTLPLF